MTLEDLVTQLRAAYGSALTAVVLYGSAATAEHFKRSDYNVLVLVESLDSAALAAASAVSRAWADAGNPAPLTLTVSEWRGSSDIFPMEYADILERHRVLFGTPPFDGIRVDLKDLRLQLEQEAMGKLIRLRQGVLASGNDAQRQVELLAASMSAIMVIFRAFLRLHGEVPSKDSTTVAQAVARKAGFDEAPFVAVVRHTRGEAKLDAAAAAGVLDGYLRGMEKLVAYLDQYHAFAS